MFFGFVLLLCFLISKSLKTRDFKQKSVTIRWIVFCRSQNAWHLMKLNRWQEREPVTGNQLSEGRESSSSVTLVSALTQLYCMGKGCWDLVRKHKWEVRSSSFFGIHQVWVQLIWVCNTRNKSLPDSQWDWAAIMSLIFFPSLTRPHNPLSLFFCTCCSLCLDHSSSFWSG